MFRRFFAALLAMLMLPLLSLACLAAPEETGSGSDGIPEAERELPDTSVCDCVLLYNIDSGTLMYSENGDKPVYPASTVKLMVALLARELLFERMDERVTISKTVVAKSSTIKMSLREGENIPIRDLFTGLLVAGASDAAVALAEAACGNVEVFISRMNVKAKALGMEHTNYVNVTGVDNYSQQTTGNDLLRLCLAAYADDFIRETVKLAKTTVPSTNMRGVRTLYTRNYLLSRLTYPYYIMNEADGMNAGSTQKAGGCLCATASIRNTRYLCIVMGGIYTDGVWNDEPVKIWKNFTLAKEMFQWGAKYYEYRAVISPMQVYGEVKVELATFSDYVAAIPKKMVEIYVRRDTPTENVITVESEMWESTLIAPVEEGVTVGTVRIKDADGRVIGETELVTKNSLNLSRLKYWEAQARGIIETRAFTVSILLVLLFAVGGVLITARVRYKRQTRLALRRQDR